MNETLKLDNCTYDDYLEIDKSTAEHVELIDGKIYRIAGTGNRHQDTE